MSIYAHQLTAVGDVARGFVSRVAACLPLLGITAFCHLLAGRNVACNFSKTGVAKKKYGLFIARFGAEAYKAAPCRVLLCSWNYEPGSWSLIWTL